jgi:hypothetical protein
MNNRRAFLPLLTASVVALGVIVAPVIADELFGVITKVDVESKKLTVQSKDGDETVVTTNDDTEIVLGKEGEPRKLDLEKLATNVKKDQDAGKKGVFAKITHEKGVASRIGVFTTKKKEAPNDQ